MEISKEWDELDAKSQQGFLEKAFGKQQASVGAAIISNMGAAEQAMTNMANSAGSAEREMDTIAGKLCYLYVQKCA